MITVFGASDDLIEIEGDICAEFEHYSGDPVLLTFSDGTVLSVHYSLDGIWRIAAERRGDGFQDIVEWNDGHETYSDRATLSHARWVVYGTSMVRAAVTP